MTEQWAHLSLGELTETTRPICYGVLKPGPYVAGGVPLIRIQDMEGDRIETDGHHRISDDLDEEFKRSRLSGGEVLLSIQGTVGRVALCPPELAGANISRTVAVIEPDARLTPQFLRLYLQLVADSEGFDDTGSTRASLNISTIRAMQVPVPPLPIQRRIVDLLTHLDAHIANLRTERDALAALEQARRRESFAAIDSDVVPAREVFEMLLGRQKSARQSVGDFVLPYIRAANITTGGLRLDDVQAMNFEPNEQAKYGLVDDDILLVEGGTIGLAARWRSEIPGVVGFDKHVIRLRAKPGVSTSEFALQWAHWSRESGAFDAQATGITIRALGFGRASEMPVPRLSVEKQEEVTAPLASMGESRAFIQAEYESVRRLRSALLQNLLSRATELPDSYDASLSEAS